MTALPAEVKFGKVVGRFLLTAVDSVDAGGMPDVLPGEGSVKFVPRQPNQRVTNPELAIVTHRPVICPLDANGYLVDSQGQSEVWLATGIYDVTFSIKGVRIAPLAIHVTEEYTEVAPMDLALAIPPYGLPFGAGQYAELSSRIADVEAGAGAAFATKAEVTDKVDKALGGITQPKTISYEDIQAALDSAALDGSTVVAAGSITTSSTLTIKSDADLPRLTINYTGTGTAVQVGSGVSGNPGILWYKVVHLPRVINAGKVGTGWTGSTVGVRVVNANACTIRAPHIRNFVTGLLMDALGTGNVFNDVQADTLSNNKRNLVLSAGAGGWTNSNRFRLGALSFDSVEGANVAGTRDILIEAAPNLINGNLFSGGSVEANTPEYHLDVAGPYNRFDEVRWENAGGCRVIWQATATRNVISYGYGAESLVETSIAGSKTNQILSTSTVRFNGSVPAAMILENTSSSASASDIVLGAGGTGAGVAPLTAYAVRRSANDTRMKRDTDAADRLILDHVNGRHYFGGGATAPTVYFGMIGSGVGLVGSNLYFGTDNTQDIGLDTTTLRPRDIFLGRDLKAGRVVKSGVVATGSRPTAASSGAGAMIYDSTLSKPIWSDGTAWRDSAGTAV